MHEAERPVGEHIFTVADVRYLSCVVCIFATLPELCLHLPTAKSTKLVAFAEKKRKQDSRRT